MQKPLSIEEKAQVVLDETLALQAALRVTGQEAPLSPHIIASALRVAEMVGYERGRLEERERAAREEYKAATE